MVNELPQHDAAHLTGRQPTLKAIPQASPSAEPMSPPHQSTAQAYTHDGLEAASIHTISQVAYDECISELEHERQANRSLQILNRKLQAELATLRHQGALQHQTPQLGAQTSGGDRPIPEAVDTQAPPSRLVQLFNTRPSPQVEGSTEPALPSVGQPISASLAAAEDLPPLHPPLSPVPSYPNATSPAAESGAIESPAADKPATSSQFGFIHQLRQQEQARKHQHQAHRMPPQSLKTLDKSTARPTVQPHSPYRRGYDQFAAERLEAAEELLSPNSSRQHQPSNSATPLNSEEYGSLYAKVRQRQAQSEASTWMWILAAIVLLVGAFGAGFFLMQHLLENSNSGTSEVSIPPLQLSEPALESEGDPSAAQ